MIRENIVAAWKHEKISINELARRAGLPASAISRYLSGKRDMKGKGLDKIMAALGMGIINRQEMWRL